MSLNYRANFRMRRTVSFFLSLIVILAAGLTVTAADKKKPKAAPAKTSKKNARETSAKNAKGKANDRNSARNQPSKKESARDRKTSARDRQAQAKDNRKLPKRERGRLAAIRRREAIEAERRRRAAIALAEARRRAFDQGLRNETQANILRDETTGEDLEIRRIAVAALGNKAGSVVVMDPKSGRVYTVVNQDWALRKGYKPCSTIKLVTGMAGLTERVISPVDTINISERSYRLDLTDSLAYSNNGYFQNVGGKVGFDRMVKYARDLGLGEPTGINQPNESAGRVPLFKSGYAVNHMSSHGDDFEVTPIQLATLVSAMANGGNLLKPHLPRTPNETFSFKREVRRQIDIPADAVQRMTPGMIGAVNYGTAKLAYDPVQTIAGKTGSCIGQGSWLGLFASYAPVLDPKLAVVVVTRGSGERGKYAASVAGKIYRALDGRFVKPGEIPVAQAPGLTPRPKVDAKTAAALMDEDQEDEASDAAELGTDTVKPVGEAKQEVLKRTVLTLPTPRPAQRVTDKPAPRPGLVIPPIDQRPRIVPVN
jgi:cell division protein FtsI/penicillin-binding protein 2